MVHNIYIDESGHTGAALLDPAQPYFCVVSSLIEDAAARDILEASFPGYAADEFKFQHIWRRPNTRRRLTEFSKILHEAAAEGVYIYIIDKRFCVLTKFIDFLIEPIVHDMGYDFYKNSHAAKFSNLVHYTLLFDGTPELYEAAIGLFYRFARDPSDGRLRDLQTVLKIMSGSAPEQTRWIFSWAARGAAEFNRHSSIGTFRNALEIQFTAVFASVGYWRKKLPDEMFIRHDQSSNFFSQAELWGNLTSQNVPAQLHPVANEEPIPFPLRIIGTEPVDSRSSSSIQLCDLVAGLAARLSRGSKDRDDVKLLEEVLGAGFGELTMNGINPQPVFPDSSPLPLDGPDSVDLFTAIIESGR